MNREDQEITNRAMEIFIGNLLRTGVIIAAVVVLCGGVIYLSKYGFESADYRIFQHEPSYLCNIQGILENAFTSQGRGLIQLGLLLLIATPVARVALSIFAFARKQDMLYIAVTLTVFCILLYSLLGR